MKGHKVNRRSQHSHMNAASIMRRLPLHQQLTSSHSLLIQCSPIWLKWAQQNLAATSSSTVMLSHFKNGELIFHCENALGATQIQQQQETLLRYFQTNGLSQIKQITVRISNKPKLRPTNNDESLTDDIITTTASQTAVTQIGPINLSKNYNEKSISSITISSIKSCQKAIKNQQLSDSLSRLINTIEQN